MYNLIELMNRAEVVYHAYQKQGQCVRVLRQGSGMIVPNAHVYERG